MAGHNFIHKVQARGKKSCRFQIWYQAGWLLDLECWQSVHFGVTVLFLTCPRYFQIAYHTYHHNLYIRLQCLFQAGIEFDKRQFDGCAKLVDKLIMTRKMDPKVCHNKCVINYYQSGLRATDDLMHNLSRVCDMVGSVPVHFFTLISVVGKFLILKEKITQKHLRWNKYDAQKRKVSDIRFVQFIYNE